MGHPTFRPDISLQRSIPTIPIQESHSSQHFDHNDPANIRLKAEHKAEKLRKKSEYDRRHQNQNNNWNNNNHYGGQNNNPNYNPNNYNNNNSNYNNPQSGGGGNNNPHRQSNSGNNDNHNTTVATISELVQTSDFLPTRIFLTQQITRVAAEARNRQPITQAPSDCVTAQALLDTGALGGNFLSGRMVKRLKAEKFIYHTKNNIVVCSGLDNACYSTNALLEIEVEFLTDDNLTKLIFINTRISETSTIDLIIGRPTLKKIQFL
jgi:hypothetical protein